jgi:hypothetical protein
MLNLHVDHFDILMQFLNILRARVPRGKPLLVHIELSGVHPLPAVALCVVKVIFLQVKLDSP